MSYPSSDLVDSSSYLPHRDMLGVMIGWRMWRVYEGRKGDFLLAGTFKNDIWRPRRLKIAYHEGYRELRGISQGGQIPPHGAPNENCLCGINFYRKGSGPEMFDNFCLIGEVYVWGKVVMAERGGRGQFGYPKSIVAWGDPITGVHSLTESVSYVVEMSSRACSIYHGRNIPIPSDKTLTPLMDVVSAIVKKYRISYTEEVPEWAALESPWRLLE